MLSSGISQQDVAQEVLNSIVEAGMPICVLSNKPHEFTAAICEALLSRWPFVQCLGSVADKARKPDPGVALELASMMQLDPAEVFFVGDSDVDILTGQNAGMTSVGVTWGYRDRHILAERNPAFVVDSPVELLGVLMPKK